KSRDSRDASQLSADLESPVPERNQARRARRLRSVALSRPSLTEQIRATSSQHSPRLSQSVDSLLIVIDMMFNFVLLHTQARMCFRGPHLCQSSCHSCDVEMIASPNGSKLRVGFELAAGRPRWQTISRRLRSSASERVKISVFRAMSQHKTGSSSERFDSSCT